MMDGMALGSSSSQVPYEGKIFVGGITSKFVVAPLLLHHAYSVSTSREDLLLYFSQFGKITGVSVPWDHAARRNRGFAFVTFAVCP